MAWKHRLSNMGESALSWGSTGAQFGSFAGPKGAAIGGGVGALLGALTGLFSDTEMQELSEKWARGEIPAEVEKNIVRLVGDRFEQLRRDQGGRIARAGIQDSTFAEKLRSDMDANERSTLTTAMADKIQQYQQMGLGMMSDRQARTDQIVSGSVDNIMGIFSDFESDNRWEEMQASTEAFRQEMKALLGGGGTGKKPELNPREMKAAAMVGQMPQVGIETWGMGRGASASRHGQWRSGQFPKSIMNSKQGGGLPSSRGSTTNVSGSRQRARTGTWFNQ